MTEGYGSYSTGQSPLTAEDEARLAIHPEAEVNDLPVFGEIQYPNDGRPKAGGGPEDSVFKEKPSLFLVRGLPKTNPAAPRWAAQTLQIPAGSAPICLVSKNPHRIRLVVWTDSGSAGPAFLSPRMNGVTGTGSGSVGLAAGSVPFEMRHTGQVFAFSPLGAVIYYYEESLDG